MSGGREGDLFGTDSELVYPRAPSATQLGADT